MSAAVNHNKKTAHDTAKTVKKDTLEKLTSIKDDPTFQYVKTFVTTNSSDAKSFAQGLASIQIGSQNIQDAITTFSESTRIGMKALDELAKIHPFIAGPVLAFKLVVSLDLKRRENNMKVLAVKLQMQSMMGVLFQLRNVTDPNEVGADGRTIEGRMQGLMKHIEDDIHECGSACDVYMKKSFLKKLLKSMIYEAKLAEYGSRFVGHQTELERALSYHTAVGVDTANAKLDQQTTQLTDIKLQLEALFHRLDTPREREVRKIIETKGGPGACIKDDVVLKELVAKTGETVSDPGSQSKSEEESLGEIRKSLLSELAEDLDKVMDRNLALFKGKLDIQQREIENSIERQGDRIIAYFSGGHDRIIDPQLREIWREMGWKGSVKALDFVFALRDYFLSPMNQDTSLTVPATPIDEHTKAPTQLFITPPPTSGEKDVDPLTVAQPAQITNDDWTKSYINVTHLQPIQEAIDDDGSGFINVHEVNTFTLDRPKGWTLLQWIAYWAVGWQRSISSYRNKVYRLLRKIARLLHKIRPDNRVVVDAYLDNWNFSRIELLLRNTTPVAEGTYTEPEMTKLVEEFSKVEEARLEHHLELISYNIDSAATVALLSGPSRIERHIYPLLYVLLKQHVTIIQLGRTEVLHLDELDYCIESFTSIFTALDARCEDLAAVFKQMGLNPERQFENYAFGMFKGSYGEIPWNISANKLDSAWDDLVLETGEDNDVDEIPQDLPDPQKALKFGPQEPYYFPPGAPAEIDEALLEEIHSSDVGGAWSGYLMDLRDGEYYPFEGLFRFSIKISGDNPATLGGNGESYIGQLELEGVTTTKEDGKPEVDFVVTYVTDGYWIRCIGIFDSASMTIKGEWFTTADDTGLKPTPGTPNTVEPRGRFTFSRTPAAVARFKYSDEAFAENAPKARWSFACNAILEDVRRKRFTKEYVFKRLTKNRRFRELMIKRKVRMEGFASKGRVDYNEEEYEELSELERSMPPGVDSFVYSLARFIFLRLPRFSNFTCDACDKTLIQSRLACITCINDTFVVSLDFCIGDRDSLLPHHTYRHTASHTLIRGDYVIHDFQLAWMFPAARARSERIKTAFRALEAETKSQSDGGDSESEKEVNEELEEHEGDAAGEGEGQEHEEGDEATHDDSEQVSPEAETEVKAKEEVPPPEMCEALVNADEVDSLQEDAETDQENPEEQDGEASADVVVDSHEPETNVTEEAPKDQADADTDKSSEKSDDDDSSPAFDPKCVFCEKKIILPCWMCLECTSDVFVCDDCDAIKQLPPLPHKVVPTPCKVTHVSIRLTNSESVETEESDQLTRVEKRLDVVKSNVQERLERLEQQLQERTSALEDALSSHLDGIKNKMELEERFTSIEEKVTENGRALEERLSALESNLDRRLKGLEDILRKFLAPEQQGRATITGPMA